MDSGCGYNSLCSGTFTEDMGEKIGRNPWGGAFEWADNVSSSSAKLDKDIDTPRALWF